MLQHRTVNLVILSTSDDGKDVSNETRYRRLQDFFLNAKLCYQSIGSCGRRRESGVIWAV